MTLAELLCGAAVDKAAGRLDVEIRGLSHDSRRTEPGDAFFALPGSATDGNRFAKDAVAHGAAAVVSELAPPPAPFSLAPPRRPETPATWVQVASAPAALSRASASFFGHPSASMAVVGVTGTNGKTTTTYLLESVLSKAGGGVGVIGTVTHRLKGRVLERAANTTPLSLELQRMLKGMKDGGASHVAMEVSSHALALRRADDVDFDAAVFTNLRRDHLDFHKTREEYLEAKSRLFDVLTRLESTKKRRAAVLNADDESFLKLKRRAPGADILSYGLAPLAQVRGEAVVATPESTLFRMSYKDRSWHVRLKLVGDYNVHNALAASAVAFWLGQDDRSLVQGLEALESVPGRLEPVREGQPYHVFVDFAHTDSALDAVLRCLGRLPHKRLLTVFGCGGDRDRGKRPPMGEAACALSDLAFATSDNPRSEDPAAILAEVERGCVASGRQNYRIILDRREAVFEAIRQAREGDIVLIAGKGHEDTQVLKDRAVHFDDRETAREAIKAAG